MGRGEYTRKAAETQLFRVGRDVPIPRGFDASLACRFRNNVSVVNLYGVFGTFGFSASAIAFRNSSTALNWGVGFRQFLASYRHSGDESSEFPPQALL